MRNRLGTFSTNATFYALADPTRRALLDLLRQDGAQPAGRIAECFPVSRPAVSKHLRVLRRANLVRERRQGRHRLYQLNPDALRGVERWIDEYRVFWNTRLHHLKEFVEDPRPKPSGGAKAATRRRKKHA